MGCDIHCYLEYREHNGKWDNDHVYTNKRGEFELLPVYYERDYELFAILAGVRSDEIKPIVEPRGIPEDINEEIKKIYDNWGINAHTPSWYTLKELLNNKKKFRKIRRSGMVDEGTYNNYVNNKVTPTSWCEWTSLPNHVYLTWTDKSYSIKNLIQAIENRCEEAYIYYANPEDIRIVFWFDN